MSEPARVGESLDGIDTRIAQVRARQRDANRIPPAKLYHCPVCLDTGWEELQGLSHGFSVGTVQRCPNHCPLPEVKRFDSPPVQSHRPRADGEVF